MVRTAVVVKSLSFLPVSTVGPFCPTQNQGPQGTETKDNDLQSPDALGVSSTWHCPVGTVPSLAHTAHR